MHPRFRLRAPIMRKGKIRAAKAAVALSKRRAARARQRLLDPALRTQSYCEGPTSLERKECLTSFTNDVPSRCLRDSAACEPQTGTHHSQIAQAHRPTCDTGDDQVAEALGIHIEGEWVCRLAISFGRAVCRPEQPPCARSLDHGVDHVSATLLSRRNPVCRSHSGSNATSPQPEEPCRGSLGPAVRWPDVIRGPGPFTTLPRSCQRRAKLTLLEPKRR